MKSVLCVRIVVCICVLFDWHSIIIAPTKSSIGKWAKFKSSFIVCFYWSTKENYNIGCCNRLEWKCTRKSSKICDFNRNLHKNSSQKHSDIRLIEYSLFWYRVTQKKYDKNKRKRKTRTCGATVVTTWMIKMLILMCVRWYAQFSSFSLFFCFLLLSIFHGTRHKVSRDRDWNSSF